MTKKKVCMLGSFAVGKTSLVQRFVRSVFSEKYLTTVGVRIDQKALVVDGEDVLLMLWDIHGEDDFQKVKASYLTGMSGYLLVVDGTRRVTLDVALQLRDLAVRTAGDVPYVLIVNKADLADRWEIPEESLAGLQNAGVRIIRASAMTGDMVEDAFLTLASDMLR